MTPEKPDNHPYDWAVNGPPLGEWQTHEGSFSMQMGSRLTIRSDGTGLLTDSSALRGQAESEIVWRHIGPGHLQLMQFAEGDDNKDPSEHHWENIHYCAAWAKGDTTTRVPILKDQDAESFWSLLSPVTLAARAE